MYFRYTAGRRGVNLVTVFRRTKDGPIQIETWPNNKRKRETLRNKLGKPLYDEKRAMKIADIVASEIERSSHHDLDKLLGIPERHTFKDLLYTYHAKRGRKWVSNKRHQEIARDFWLHRIAPNMDVRKVASIVSDIERMASEAAIEMGWSPRTEGKYLKYLRTAFNFGRKKLKWFGEEHDLAALKIPPADSESKPYSQEETMALLEAAPKIDLRCGVAAWVGYLGLRRVGAIRHVKLESIERDGEDLVLFFGRKTDKAKRSGEVVISDPYAVELIEQLMQKPAAKASGFLFPRGDLKSKTPPDAPCRYEMLNHWLDEAEILAGVKHVEGRSYHGLKRRAATEADRAGMLSQASKQAKTNVKTLGETYVQHDREPKRELSKALAKRARSN